MLSTTSILASVCRDGTHDRDRQGAYGTNDVHYRILLYSFEEWVYKILINCRYKINTYCLLTQKKIQFSKQNNKNIWFDILILIGYTKCPLVKNIETKLNWHPNPLLTYGKIISLY